MKSDHDYIVEADDYDTVEKFLKEVICAQCKLTDEQDGLPIRRFTK